VAGNPKKTNGSLCGMEYDGKDLFLVHRGIRIAKRGKPGTPHARTWVSLEPGYRVFDGPDLKEIIVEYKDMAVQ